MFRLAASCTCSPSIDGLPNNLNIWPILADGVSIEGLSGMLVYWNASYLFLMEGEAKELSSAWERVLSHPGFANRVLILREEVAKREFADLPVGFRNLQYGELPAGFDNLAGIADQGAASGPLALGLLHYFAERTRQESAMASQ